MTQIVLCADDFGLSPGVNRGILELIEAGRISATSCMAVFPEFAADGPKLLEHQDRIDIGLHLTLTASRPLRQVMAAAYLRQLKAEEIVGELARQIDRFRKVLGREPDYIDGHQHVHQLPVIREAVCARAQEIGCYVRVTSEPLTPALLRRPAAFSSAFLSLMGVPLARECRARGISTNGGFRGTRSFKEREPYRALFRRIIEGVRDRSIVICHPGWPDDILAARDSVVQPRADEMRYLSGPEFAADLKAASATLCRLGRASSP